MTTSATPSRESTRRVPGPEEIVEAAGSPLRTTALDLVWPGRTTVVDLPRPERLAPQGFRVPGVAREIEVKMACDRQEWEDACRLVAANYRARGYETPSAKRLRFTPYHALPDSHILVAKHAGRVVATFSIVLDNTLLGLPMECIYGQEIAELRRQGRRLLETTSLADDGLSVREFIQVFVALIKLGMQYHASQGGDTYVITVNPRHRSFYAKVLGFLPLGPCRTYSAVQDAPAEAYWLDNTLLAKNAPRMYQEIFGVALPPAALLTRGMPRDLVLEFDGQSTLGDRRKVEDALEYVDHYGSPRRW
jgi:hypothetical protein